MQLNIQLILKIFCDGVRIKVGGLDCLIRMKLLLLLVFFPGLDLITVNCKHSANPGQRTLCWHNPINISVLGIKTAFITHVVCYMKQRLSCAIYNHEMPDSIGKDSLALSLILLGNYLFWGFIVRQISPLLPVLLWQLFSPCT